MNLKTKALAAAATLALIGGASAAGALSAHAATPSCGTTCIDTFSRAFGTHRTPGFVMDVFQQATRVGQPVILYRTSLTDPAEDFSLSFQGQVSDFYAAGLVSSAVNLHYGCNWNANTNMCGNTAFNDEFAWEVEYSPYGVDSGLCVGVASTAVQDEHVTLQPCGVSGKTVWISDTADSTGFFSDYTPAINGSDTNFSHPFVMTYPTNGYPTDSPRPQLLVDGLTGFSGGFLPGPGTVNDFQEWGADFGVLR
jgi:hypothetical protein